MEEPSNFQQKAEADKPDSSTTLIINPPPQPTKPYTAKDVEVILEESNRDFQYLKRLIEQQLVRHGQEKTDLWDRLAAALNEVDADTSLPTTRHEYLNEMLQDLKVRQTEEREMMRKRLDNMDMRRIRWAKKMAPGKWEEAENRSILEEDFWVM